MIRQKIIHCDKYGKKSKYIEVDLFSYLGVKAKGIRNKKKEESAPQQKSLNDKRAKRYFNQLGKTNFGDEDLHVSLTYSKENTPETVEEAENEALNYLRRLKRKREKEGLPPLKYLLVTERGQKGKVHHHIIMNGGLDRDLVEIMWTKDRINWKKYESDRLYRKSIKPIGYANADRLQVDEKGIEGLCNYLCKDPQGRRRWKQSKNLIKPWYKNPVDGRYSKRKIKQMATIPQDCEEVRRFWESKYKGYQLDESIPEFNQVTGQWSIYLKMSLKDEIERHK
ncbi:MAG: hypothetical protein VB018_03870 [Lachnospiraceae bacterium]|nr:hypothetical protein [Lachnospiraceae bacterium]